MKKGLVIFGCGDIGELAHFYFSNEDRYEVAAFTVDAEYLREDSFCGAPVVAACDIARSFPPDRFDYFVALSYAGVNAVRKAKYLQAKQNGYQLASYVSPHATVLNNGNIGDNCFILEDNTIQPFAKIGNNVTLWSGNHIGHHSIIGDHCFITSHVVVSGGVEVGEQCFLGVNATVRDHIVIGERCVVGAGALLLEDAAPEGVYVGTGSPRSRVPSRRLPRL